MSRYIDADVLKQKWLFRGKNGKPYRDEIDAMPTADVVEVVHGGWIPNRFKTLREDGWYECSVCGVGNKLYNRGVRKSDVPNIDGKSYELKNIANYCPNCGAKMERRKDAEIH